MILVIDNYDSFTYNLVHLVAKYYQPIKVVYSDQITLAQIEQMAPKGIVLSPGPGHPKEAKICLDVMEYFKGEIPLLGVCLGMQALALFYGSQIIRASPCMHGKFSWIDHSKTSLFKDLEAPLRVGRYHSLKVDEKSVSKELEVLAKTEEGVIMAIKHRAHPLYGLQFHPESILTFNGDKIMKNFLEETQLLKKQDS